MASAEDVKRWELCEAVLGHRFVAPDVPTHKVFDYATDKPLYDEYLLVCRQCGYEERAHCPPGARIHLYHKVLGNTDMGKAEGTVADYLVEQVETVGGMCDKVHAESTRGFPDYLITWPDGAMKKVETKSKDGVCSPMQDRYHRQSARRRCLVAVLHTRELVDEFVHIHRIHWEGYWK